jgi:hypothetical protein
MATRDQIVDVLDILNEAYPNVKWKVTPELISLWQDIIGKYELPLLLAATKKHIAESPYMPTIADIVKQVRSLVCLGQPTAADAWGIVSDNIRKYGPYNVKAGVDALPVMVRRVVDQIGYMSICMDEKPDVIRAQFMRMYQETLDRDAEMLLLPDGVLPVVRQIAANVERRQIASGEAVSLKQLLAGVEPCGK